MSYGDPRDHPPMEEIPYMSTESLWDYVLPRVHYLGTPEQKRIAQPMVRAIEELNRRMMGRTAYHAYRARQLPSPVRNKEGDSGG